MDEDSSRRRVFVDKTPARRMNRPLIWFAGSFATGIILQSAFSFSIVFLSGIGLLLLLCSLFVLVRGGRAVPFLLLLCITCGGLWFFIADKERVTNLGAAADHKVTVQGKVVSYPLVQGDKLVCDVMVNSIRIRSREVQGVPPEKVRLYVFCEENSGKQKWEEKKNRTDLCYGHVISAKGKLVLPQEKRNPGEFDYREYLRSRKIYHLLYVYREEDVVVIGTGQANPLLEAAFDLRDSFSREVSECLSERQSGLLLGMLFGEQAGIFEEDLEIFLKTGIAHALSVSGLHVGLVLLLVLSLCRIAGMGKKGTLFLSILALSGYCLLSAFTVTVVRATIMGILGLLAYHFDRERNIFIALAASGLVILIWNPYYLFDPGFQLSFAAVWAIAYLEPWLSQLLPDFLYGRGSWLTVPLAAQLGTFPIIAWHFNLVSPLSVIVNILLVPLMSGIVIIGLFAFILSFVSVFTAETLLGASGFLIDLLVYSGEWMASLPGTVYYVATPFMFFLAAYYLLLVAVRESLLTKGTLYLGNPTGKSIAGGECCQQNPAGFLPMRILLLIIAAATLCWVMGAWAGDDILRLYFLDVGQGDAIFMEAPSGVTVLVDGGGMPGYMDGGYDPGQDTVLPFLRRQGIRHVDLLVNTHPDEDHLDGLEDVLRDMPVGAIVTTPTGQWQEKYESFLNLAREKEVPSTELSRGAVIRLDDEVVLKVLAPEKAKRYESSNDASLVLEICHGENRFLLLGDLESQGIDSLMGKVPDLDCTVLKIPHHGSEGSFNRLLYKKSAPEAVIISVGRNNTFGHPSPQVVEFWEEAGVPLFRTDLNGGITVESDGTKISVQCVHPVSENLPF